MPSKCSRRNLTPTIEEIVGKTSYRKFRRVSDEGFTFHINNFNPGQKDVILNTQPKTGTTWLQVICHFLRGGDANYEDIYEVVPWHQLAWDVDQNVMDQRGLRPRIFKSHQLISAEIPGCKYIITIRDPADVLKSWYSFTKTKPIPELENISTIEEFYESKNCFQDDMIMWAGAWDFMRETYQVRNHPDVLVLVYEDMIKDLRSELPRIAQFLDISLDDELIERVLYHSSKPVMLKEVSKYSDLWPPKRMALSGRSSWPTQAYSPKVVKSGWYSTLSPEIIGKVRSDFIREVGEVFEGHLTGYRDFQDAIRKATWAKTFRFENIMTHGEQVEVAFSRSSKTLRKMGICNRETITTLQFFCVSKCIRKLCVLGARSFGREMDRRSKHPESIVSDHFLRNREISGGRSLLLPTLMDVLAEILSVMSNKLRNIKQIFRYI